MINNTNIPRGGGVVFNPQNLKKVSAIITKDGLVIEAKTPQEKDAIIKKQLGKK